MVRHASSSPPSSAGSRRTGPTATGTRRASRSRRSPCSAPNPDLDRAGPEGLRLRSWLHPAVVSAAALASAAGFAQFGVAAALSDVAAAFGEPQPELGLTDVAGLSGTALGIGLSLIRLASLGALPLGALGDRFGRR